MCLSPEDMTSEYIENLLTGLREEIADKSNSVYTISRFRAMVENYEALLKERAENGTYATAGHSETHTPARYYARHG